MIIGGKYMENITCPNCHHRHPEELDCDTAKRHADHNRSIESQHDTPSDQKAKDVEFIEEMLEHLSNGDTEMVRTMLTDWRDELKGE